MTPIKTLVRELRESEERWRHLGHPLMNVENSRLLRILDALEEAAAAVEHYAERLVELDDFEILHEYDAKTGVDHLPGTRARQFLAKYRGEEG